MPMSKSVTPHMKVTTLMHLWLTFLKLRYPSGGAERSLSRFKDMLVAAEDG